MNAGIRRLLLSSTWIKAQSKSSGSSLCHQTARNKVGTKAGTENSCPTGTLPATSFDANSRIHSLDGLRAVSIALVMAGHFTKINMFPGGFGVTVFFVISGFLITHLLLKELDRTGTIDLLAFYKRRAFRLLPAIIVSMSGIAILQYHLDRDWIDLPRALASIFFVQNYYTPFTQLPGNSFAR